ncbi:MAG: alkaline phosphatase family protein [Nanoarchaeota archaeon]|nr:alkaline phosphatase family protein [Nanoarchaeota archaeon]
MNRRAFLKTLGYGTVTSLAGCPTLIRTSHKPESTKKVLLIGVDGLRPDALQVAATPYIDSLVTEGAYSFAARTGEYTISGPGWSNILTGVWENKHGVKDNTFQGVDYQKYPTVFTHLEKYRPELNTAALASWGEITDSIATAADRRLFFPFNQEGDFRVARAAASLLDSTDVDMMFAYFMGVDEAGHKYGFAPDVPKYLSEIEIIDQYVGMMMKGLKRRLTYNQEAWLTILTSDHGGKGKSHGGVGEEAMKVPLIMHGPAVQKGELLPVPRQVDIAPTILSYLGIPLRAEWGLDGKVISLKESYLKTESYQR